MRRAWRRGAARAVAGGAVLALVLLAMRMPRAARPGACQAALCAAHAGALARWQVGCMHGM